MPWSISPRFSNGLSTYSRLFSQVLSGDGNSFAHVLLEMAQRPITTATPTSGRSSQSSLSFFMEVLSCAFSGLQIVHSEHLCVFLRLGRIELHAVEKRFRLAVRAAVR